MAIEIEIQRVGFCVDMGEVALEGSYNLPGEEGSRHYVPSWMTRLFEAGAIEVDGPLINNCIGVVMPLNDDEDIAEQIAQHVKTIREKVS